MMPAAPAPPVEAFGPVLAFPDAARRMSDQVNLHLAAGQVMRWAAIRLADGTSDGVAYDTKQDAIRHQLHEELCTYVLIQPGGMQPREADAVLRFTRWAYDNGYRIRDPDDPLPVMPGRMEALDKIVTQRMRL